MLLDALARALAAYDDDAFAALASAGLYRRALKDVDRAPPVLIESAPDAVVVGADGARVRFDERGLAGAACTCPAAGVCRHVVAAAVFLARAYGGGPPRAVRSPDAERPGPTAAPPADRVRPAAGLPPTAARRALRLAPARDVVVRATDELLADCVEIGLSHLSGAHAERFAALAIEASGAQLYRLALLLRRMGERVEALERRDASADEDRLFDDLALAHALAAGLRRAFGARVAPAPHLVGEARSQYEDAGALELRGVAATPWRTASGYAGLTLLFWAPRAERWATWSDARPSFAGAYDAHARYHAPGPWNGADSPAALLGSAVHLANARVNRFGRISGAAATSAVVRPRAFGAELRFGRYELSAWRELRARVRENASVTGLRERDPREAFVVLRPAVVRAATFDPIAQRVRWPLDDATGDTLDATLPHDAVSHRAVARLDALSAPDRERVGGVVAHASLRAGEVVVEPRALLLRDAEPAVDALFFDGAARAAAIASGTPPAALSAQPSATVPSRSDAPAADRVLDPVDAALIRLAERGIGRDGEALDTHAELAAVIASAANAGLTAFALPPRGVRPAFALLRLRYVSRLARDLA